MQTLVHWTRSSRILRSNTDSFEEGEGRNRAFILHTTGKERGFHTSEFRYLTNQSAATLHEEIRASPKWESTFETVKCPLNTNSIPSLLTARQACKASVKNLPVEAFLLSDLIVDTQSSFFLQGIAVSAHTILPHSAVSLRTRMPR